MDYKEAAKKVASEKAGTSYMVVQFSYNSKLVMPYEDGIKFLQSLNKAEQFNTPYQGQEGITPIQQDTIHATYLSSSEYRQYKIAALLRISVTDVMEMEKGEPA